MNFASLSVLSGDVMFFNVFVRNDKTLFITTTDIKTTWC